MTLNLSTTVPTVYSDTLSGSDRYINAMEGKTMEWITELLKQFTGEDGKLDEKGFGEALKTETPKHVVPKDQYNNVSASLKEANKTIKTLEDKSKDNPEIQKELETYKTKATELEAENKQLLITQQVSNALRDAGAKDIEYATFKLGALELDSKGNVKDLANKVKDLQSAVPDFFESNSDPAPSNLLGGFNQLTPNPGEGKPTQTFSIAEIEKMTPEQINENWEAVSASLSQGGNE